MTETQVSTGNTECCLTQHTNVYLEGHAGLDYFDSEANVPVMKEHCIYWAPSDSIRVMSGDRKAGSKCVMYQLF